jgi:hypothetical protein
MGGHRVRSSRSSDALVKGPRREARIRADWDAMIEAVPVATIACVSDLQRRSDLVVQIVA